MVVMPRSPLATEAFVQVMRTRGAAIATAVVPEVEQRRSVGVSTRAEEIIAPDGSQPAGPLGGAVEQALAAIGQMETVDAFDQLVADLQGQITALSGRVDQQAEQIARLNAALQCFDCPDNLQDPNHKERHVASVAVCQREGICTCDVGYMLNMPSVPVPPSGDAEGEAAASEAAALGA